MQKRQQILCWTTVGFTYLLMVWGNLVSSTGSGLACPDWPLCHGTVAPALSAPVVLEWGHRLLAFCATVLISATLYVSFFKQKTQATPHLRKSGKSLLALLAAQILLGGSTVLVGLSPWISSVHLVIATLVLGGLITLACVITWGDPTVGGQTKKVKRLAQAGIFALLVQLALGALVRHHHSGLACPNFPNCVEGFWPLPVSFERILAFVHRWWGVILLGVFVHILLEAQRNARKLVHPARQLFGLSVAQILLGIGTVLSGLNTESRAIHAAVGYAIWGLLFYLTVRAGGFRWLWHASPRS